MNGIKDLIQNRIRDKEERLTLWDFLAKKKVWHEPPILEQGEELQKKRREELKKTLWAEAVRALFDACARAHKRDLEK